MLLRISPRSLASRKLFIRPFANSDHVAEAAGLRVGWILHVGADAGRDWWWSIIGPSCALARVRKTGRCETLADAKSELAATYGQWLEWALSQEADVTWFTRSPQQRPAPGLGGALAPLPLELSKQPLVSP